MKTEEIIVPVRAEGLDEAIEKAKKLSELLIEAKSLAGEIASMEIELHLDS